MLVRIELHCHSNHSDGSLPAAEVATLARARQVTLFCLTDHDTCDGYAATQANFPNALRGVELSCSEEGRSVHLLVYQREGDARWATMEEALSAQKQTRRDRVYMIADNLAKLGVHFDAERLLEQVPGSIGRPHIANELVRLGLVESREHAFSSYLKDGGPGDVQVNRPSLAEGIDLGRQAGGCMSLAHPHMYGKQAEALIRRHKSLGLSGLEVFYGGYKPKARRKWAGLATECGMVATGGSDFHGDQKPGILRPGVDMPEEESKRLAAWLGRG